LAEAKAAGGFVAVQEFFLTRTARMADVVLPAQTFIEREGTFTSGERRVQRFYPSVAPFLGPKADFKIAAEVAQRLGSPLESRFASLVFQRITAEVPDYQGVTYPKLSQVHEQSPQIGRQDMYYGGTGYDNHQGLGVQLQPGVQSGRWTADPAAQMPADGEKRAAAQAGELWVMPVTRLYDQGVTVVDSPLLRGRLTRTEVWLNPATAANLQLANNDQVSLWVDGVQVTVQVKVNDTLPDGVGLVPRSAGIPVFAPRAVKIQRLAEVAASPSAAS
jgi:NADH-quinone oxidoreductase subunit G